MIQVVLYYVSLITICLEIVVKKEMQGFFLFVFFSFMVAGLESLS